MGFFRKSVDVLGARAHREMLRKTIGRPLKNDRIKPLLAETVRNLLWACLVLGDRCFPMLGGRRLLGTVHLGGLIVLLAAGLIPALLIVRAGRRLTDFGWVNERRHIQKQNATKPIQGDTDDDTGKTADTGGRAEDGGG